MGTIDRNACGVSASGWSYESNLAAMSADMLAARMTSLAEIITGEPLLTSTLFDPAVDSIRVGCASRYICALEFLRTALEYASITGGLNIRFSLQPGSTHAVGGEGDQSLRICLIWDQSTSKDNRCEQAECWNCGERPVRRGGSDCTKVELTQDKEFRAWTLMSKDDEVGLQLSWPAAADGTPGCGWLLPRENHPTVLIVDDNPAHLKYLRMILEDGGFIVEPALSAESAIESVKSRTGAMNLAMISTRLRGSSADTLVRALRNESPTTRVILTSDGECPKISPGLHGYPLLLDPISPLELLTVSSRAVRTKQVRQERPGVLVTDDEPAVRGLIRMALSAEGYDIVEAGNGDEAAQALQCHDIDVVLLDLIMPDREGLETIRSIKKKISPLSVVAMSGASGGYLAVAKYLGADIVLKKPLVIQEVVDSVRLALAVNAERRATTGLDCPVAMPERSVCPMGR